MTDEAITAKKEYTKWFQTKLKTYSDLYNAQQTSLDKQLLAVSTASLAFSVLLAESIIENGDLTAVDALAVGWISWTDFIIFTWGCFSLSIVATIWSLKCGAEAALDFRNQHKNMSGTITDHTILNSNWISRVEILNSISIGTFTLGIFCLLIFSSIGLTNQMDNKVEKIANRNKTTVSTGAEPLQPSKITGIRPINTTQPTQPSELQKAQEANKTAEKTSDTSKVP